jgi:hypothetical protein
MTIDNETLGYLKYEGGLTEDGYLDFFPDESPPQRLAISECCCGTRRTHIKYCTEA